MLKKNWFFCLFFIFSLFVSGCSTNNQELYKGDTLKIAVVGDIPKSEEENIFFSNITFEDLETNIVSVNSDNDAVFIMPEKLVEASDNKYVEVYKQLNIPTFFIGTTKAHIPFIFDSVTYNDAPDVSPKSYAAGYLYDPENELGETWRFTKEKDNKEKITEKEIKKIYSEIFNKISYIKENRLKYPQTK